MPYYQTNLDTIYARDFSGSVHSTFPVPYWPTTVVGALTANAAYGHRIRIKRAGTIGSFWVFVITQSGNMDGGIFSISGTTRTCLWSAGATAVGAGTTWQNLGNPAIAVQAGDLLDFVISCDNGTATFARGGMVSGNISALPAGLDETADAINWTKATNYPLPTVTNTIVTPSATTAVILIVTKVT